MIEFIKKIFGFLSVLPAFSSLFRKAAQTGRIDPIETLSALSSFSPSTQKITDVAMNAAQHGGRISDVATAISDIGEVEVMGQKLNMKTLTNDLRRAGGICSMLGGIIDKMQGQSPQEIVDFGNAASNVSNWKDIVKDTIR